ncbi:FixH family protein [Dictyobacter arantiisoli]|uniref:YtkA-like domain-containing protein n=1 Tax=Dictyobacter arantiisoli TaxID=2014874 RepID=A0A5A5T741_9CHLR|nr:FixH family protein [Dictyobacter arantiisoli]GCF07217.1 hypothetical protein KDI_07810 [Dictyobacter arantiisoli]
MKRRQLLILMLGIALLILFTVLATSLDSLFPPPTSATVQVAQAGPYQISFSVNPNPPHVAQVAALTVHIINKETQQSIDNAHVTLAISMLTMDMGTDTVTAQSQASGMYRGTYQFSMSGSWAVHIAIAMPGQPVQSTSFDVTVANS